MPDVPGQIAKPSLEEVQRLFRRLLDAVPDARANQNLDYFLGADSELLALAFQHHRFEADAFERDLKRALERAERKPKGWELTSWKREGEKRRKDNGNIIDFADKLSRNSRQKTKARARAIRDADDGPLAAAIAELNEEFFFSGRSPNSFVYRYRLGGQLLDVPRAMYVKAFLDDVANRLVIFDEENEVQVGPQWLKHPQRRTANGGLIVDPTLPFGFTDPDHVPHQAYNTWRGPVVQPVAGDCRFVLRYFQKCLCDNDPKVFDYVIRWFAWNVQHPELRPETGLIFTGGFGWGKSTLHDILERVYGRQHCGLIYERKRSLTNFNIFTLAWKFMFLDEAVFAGDADFANDLKGRITAATRMVEGKNLPIETVINIVAMIIFSNDDDPVRLFRHDRRWLKKTVSNRYWAPREGEPLGSTKLKPYQIARNRRYWDLFYAKLGSAMPALLHYLMALDLTGFNIRNVPFTQEMADAQQRSAKAVEQWWRTCLQRGYVCKARYAHNVEELQQWYDWVPTALLHQSFLRWLRDNPQGRNRVPEADRSRFGTAFGKLIEQFPKRARDPATRIEEESDDGVLVKTQVAQPYGYMLGLLSGARHRFAQTHGVPTGGWEENDDADVTDLFDTHIPE